MRFSAPTGSVSVFCVDAARITVRLTKRLSACITRVRSGRSTSQNRMMRVVSVSFSAEWMNVSSNSRSSPSRHEYGSPST